MDKEISEWIDGQIRSRAHELSSIKKCGGPFCRNPDPLKEDLKILNRIKEELGAKGEAAQKPRNFAHGSAYREKAAMLAWLADQAANRESYIDDCDYYDKISQVVEKILMDDLRRKPYPISAVRAERHVREHGNRKAIYVKRIGA